MYMYQRVRLRSSQAGLYWHVTCCMNTILVYRFNKQASHVLLSIQFDTNVSQLLRHVLSWSCDPLPSLGESCLFWLCIPPVVYGRHILYLRGLRVTLFSEKTENQSPNVFFSVSLFSEKKTFGDWFKLFLSSVTDSNWNPVTDTVGPLDLTRVFIPVPRFLRTHPPLSPVIFRDWGRWIVTIIRKGEKGKGKKEREKEDSGIKIMNRGDDSSVGGCVGRFFSDKNSWPTNSLFWTHQFFWP